MSGTIESLLVNLGADDDDLQAAFADAEKTIKEFGDELKDVGESMSAGLTVPLTAFGGLAGKVANDFDSAQGRIQAQLGLTASEAQELGSIAEEVWKDNFGENVREAGDAIAIVKKNLKDLKGDELKEATENAFILRDAFEYEVNESTRAAKALMDKFGISGTKAFDYITIGAQKGADYSGELLDTISEYSTYFSAAGMSIDGMFNILIQGAQNGAWNLDKVGDAVKEFNIRAKDGSKTTADGFKAIGLDASKMGEAIAKGGEDGQKAFMATIAALAALKDPVAQNAAGVALFGTQWEDLESKVMTSLDPTKNMLGEVEGATKKAGDALYNNFGARATSTWRETLSAMEPIGEILLDFADDVLPKVSSAIEDVSKWFDNLSPNMQQATVIIGILMAAIGPIITGIGLLSAALATVSWPIVGIVAGIALLAAGLTIAWKKSETFRDIVTTTFNKVKDIALQVFGVVRDFIMEKVSEIQKFWAENGSKITNATRNIFNFIEKIIEYVMPYVASLVEYYWGYIKGVIDVALKLIMGLVKTFGIVFGTDWGNLWDDANKKADKKLNELSENIVSKFEKLKYVIPKWFNETETEIENSLEGWKNSFENWFSSMPSVITNKLVEWKNSIVQWSKDQNEENKRQFSEWGNTIKEWFTSIPEIIKSEMDVWKNSITTWYDVTKQNIITKLGEWGVSITEWFSAVPSKIQEKLEEWKNVITTWYDSTKENIKTKLFEWGTSIESWFKNMPSNISTWLEDWKSNIAQKYTEIKEVIKTRLEEWYQSIKQWFTDLPNKPEIKDAGKNMVNKMTDGNNEKKQEFMDKLGKIIVDVAAGALAIAAIALVAAGRELIKRVIDGIKEIDIKGTGKNIIGDLISGMGSKFGELMNKAREAVNSIKSIFSNFSLSLPNIKTPHFKLRNWSPNPVDWIRAMPSIDISWYKTGGIFDGASVVGVGEAGPEAVVPLQGHRMKPFANEIANQMDNASSTNKSGAVYEFNLSIPVDGRELVKRTIRYTAEELERMRVRSKGAVT